MIQFHPVTAETKAVFDKYIKGSRIRNCDMAFANIYCWQETYRSEWAEADGFLIVRYRINGGRLTAYMQPVRAGGSEDFTRLIPLLESDAASLGQPLRITGLTSEAAALLRQAYPEKFVFADNRSAADYIYAAADLRNLTGRKYQPKRNHLNRFNDLYDYSYEPLTADMKDECMALEREWCRHHENCDDSSITAERRAMQRGFDKFDELGLTGGAIRIGGRIAAFTYGSPVNDDTFVIHIEKADTAYEGIFPAINRLFACRIPERYEYINREEDMGVEGLRRSKMSYHPVMLQSKITAAVLDGEEREIKRLWTDVFGDDETFVDNFLINCRPHVRSFLHYEEGELASMLHVVPLRSGNGMRIAYIYAVATDPRHRRKGFATALMHMAMDSVRRTFDAAALIPSGDEVKRFYGQFGFEETGTRIEFDTDFDFGSGDADRNTAMICRLDDTRTLSQDEGRLRLEDTATTLPEL